MMWVHCAKAIGMHPTQHALQSQVPSSQAACTAKPVADSGMRRYSLCCNRGNREQQASPALLAALSLLRVLLVWVGELPPAAEGEPEVVEGVDLLPGR